MENLNIAFGTIGALHRPVGGGYPIITLPIKMVDEINMMRDAIQKIHASIPVQEEVSEIILPGPDGDEYGFLVDDMVTVAIVNDYKLPRSLRNQINGWDDLPKRAILPSGVTLPDFCIPKTGFFLSRNEREALPDSLIVDEFFNHITGDAGHLYSYVFPTPEVLEAKKLKDGGMNSFFPLTLIHAGCGDLVGEAAVVEMCGWKQHSITTISSMVAGEMGYPPPPKQTIFREPKDFIPESLKTPPRWYDIWG